MMFGKLFKKESYADKVERLSKEHNKLQEEDRQAGVVEHLQTEIGQFKKKKDKVHGGGFLDTIGNVAEAWQKTESKGKKKKYKRGMPEFDPFTGMPK